MSKIPFRGESPNITDAGPPWLPGGGGVRPGTPVNSLLAQALAGIVRPEISNSFRAPALDPRFVPRPPDPNPAERAQRGIPPAAVSPEGGGGRDLGGGAIAAGLGKLGQGAAQGIKDFKEKRAQQQAYANLLAGARERPAPIGTPPRPMSQAPAGMPQAPAGIGWGVPTPGAGGAQQQTAQPPQPGSAPPVFSQPGVGPNAGTGTFSPLGGPKSSQELGQGAGGGSWPSMAEAQAYAEQAGARYGIEPGRMSALVAKEYNQQQAGNPKFNDLGTSGGPLQLHYGHQPGVPTSLSHPGMGDDFTRANPGLDARNPADWRASVDYAASQIPQTGWTPWATSQGKLGWGSREGIGQAPSQVAGGVPLPPARPADTGNPYGAPPAGPTQLSPGQPQTGPAYSDETWNSRPQYDYSGAARPGGAAGVPVPEAPQPPLINGGQPGVYSMPGQQGMAQPPAGMRDAPAGMAQPPTGLDPLAAALAGQGDPNALPFMAPGIVDALNLQNLFGDNSFGFGGLLGGLFG
jgi:hypothetical protein